MVIVSLKIFLEYNFEFLMYFKAKFCKVFCVSVSENCQNENGSLRKKEILYRI
jgi:hypothetical protein